MFFGGGGSGETESEGHTERVDSDWTGSPIALRLPPEMKPSTGQRRRLLGKVPRIQVGDLARLKINHRSIWSVIESFVSVVSGENRSVASLRNRFVTFGHSALNSSLLHFLHADDTKEDSALLPEVPSCCASYVCLTVRGDLSSSTPLGLEVGDSPGPRLVLTKVGGCRRPWQFSCASGPWGR